MRSYLRRSSGALVVAVLVVIAACGDDDDSTEGATVAAADFQEEVNAHCQERDADIAVLFEDFPEDPSDEDLVELIGGFVPVLREYRDALEEAGVPEGDEDTFEQYRALVEDAVERFEAAADDPAKAREAFEQDDPRFPELERELGLDDCADSSE